MPGTSRYPDMPQPVPYTHVVETPSSERPEEDALLPDSYYEGNQSSSTLNSRKFDPSRKRIHTPAVLYPVRGIIYLYYNPVLWRIIRGRAVPCLVLSLCVTAALFLLLYIPLAAIMSFLSGPVALINAAITILTLAANLNSALCEGFLLEEALVNMFDAVLLLEKHSELVDVGQEIKPGAQDAVSALGEYKISPNFRPSFKVICELIFFMPISFIPIVGPFIYLAIQGNRAGPIAHYWYFRLKGMDKKQQKAFIKNYHWSYLNFGTMALGLQFIPMLSILVAFTNAIGAALWALRLEYREKKHRQFVAANHPHRPEETHYTQYA
ncbi:hypothetical protein H072_4594 [Dactylellina haptotyla CBS 200.50]|uniref:Outer spore wall protein RRT8 n=1 Tax=Dactylellina haptotyla (strain CBS 200.50) TaxID=1284197 RepID=S8AK22_DACHA|nr:hypothetical protein H072_4594 [Dactylellina haptotyla CBS 200.50]